MKTRVMKVPLFKQKKGVSNDQDAFLIICSLPLNASRKCNLQCILLFRDEVIVGGQLLQTTIMS